MQSLANTRRVCGSRSRSRYAKPRGNGCGRGWGRARDPHPAPGDGPEVLLHAMRVFLPKAKQLGNAMQKVTHTTWDSTMAGHQAAPGLQASGAQVGGVKSCFQMCESLRFGGDGQDQRRGKCPLGRIMASHKSIPSTPCQPLLQIRINSGAPQLLGSHRLIADPQHPPQHPPKPQPRLCLAAGAV